MIKINFNLTFLNIVRLEKFSFTDEIYGKRDYFFFFIFLSSFLFEASYSFFFFGENRKREQKMREPTRTLAYGWKKLSPPPW